MINVAYFGYRNWAAKILQNLVESQSLLWEITHLDRAQVVLYCGWSDIIPEKIYKTHLCLVLHPSPLPKYRGGSPLQHQIMAGEKESAVTIFRASEKLDAGEIYSQTPFPLQGTLDDIFERIIEVGTADIIKVLDDIANDTANSVKQDETQAAFFKRRTPEQSEIKDFQSKTAKEYYDFIRALTDPYPNAYIICADGRKLYFTATHLESPVKSKAVS